jgi:RNA polymerase sigma-70 factor (ECF subfamily)
LTRQSSAAIYLSYADRPSLVERIPPADRLESRRNKILDNQAQRFEQIALPHLDAVLRTAMALCGRRDQAEDLTQMAFVRALEHFDTFAPGTNCKAWLCRILRNVWIDQVRRNAVAGTAVPLDEAHEVEDRHLDEAAWSEGADVLERFSDDQVIRALSRLPEDQRLTLFLTDVEQLSQEEVAQIMGVPVGTVKSRAGRARMTLRVVLHDHAKELGFLGTRQ